jgi:SPX domain protein involved in polyphosphate accumulation
LLGSARPGEDRRLEEYRRNVMTYNVRPWVQTRYLRKAFFSHCDDYARVTFDIGLEYAPRDRFDPVPVASEMIPSDVESLYDPETSVILELKCYTSYVPLWMVDLIRRFDLHRRGFSKYAAGVMPVLRRLDYDRFPFEYDSEDF